MGRTNGDDVLSKVLKIVLAVVACFQVYQFVSVLIAPTSTLMLCEENTKQGMLLIQLGILVLNLTCLVSLFFPAGKYWKYVSIVIGGTGISLFYLIWQDYLTCEQFSWTHVSSPLWFFLYPLLLWILWGMFIPYLERRLRRLWLWGYVTGCLFVCMVYFLPEPNY